MSIKRTLPICFEEKSDVDVLKTELKLLKTLFADHDKKIKALYQKIESITPECEICKGSGKYRELDEQKICPCVKVKTEFTKIMSS